MLHKENKKENKKCSDTTGWPAAVSAASQAVPVRAALRAAAPPVLVVGHCGSEDNRARVHARTRKSFTGFVLSPRSDSKTLEIKNNECDGYRSGQGRRPLKSVQINWMRVLVTEPKTLLQVRLWVAVNSIFMHV